MKSKEPAKSKKQSIIVKDLKARKNPKGGSLDGKHVSWLGQPTTESLGNMKIKF